MKNLKSYDEWLALNEGGWSSTKTQQTTLTPKVISLVVKKIEEISREFNLHLQELELPSLDFLKPIGSGTWWKDDLENNPDRTYGDVDYLIAYPTLKLTAGNERQDEIATIKLYNRELMMFLKSENFDGIDFEETDKSSTMDSLKLIVIVDIDGNPGWVQVDMVVTSKEYSEWSAFRMTPERGIKGFVIGNLYSAFGKTLELSIQPRGVRAKFKDDVMVEFSKRSGVEERLLTMNTKTFMMDIAKFFWTQAEGNRGKIFEPSESLKNWKGINPNSPSFEELANGIIGVAETLAKLGEFGTVLKYKSVKEFLNAIVIQYESSMMEVYNAPKFKKAETPAAEAMIKKTRELIDTYINKTKNLLK